MSFFTIPYQIHFEDTMAYGSHHYLTNFRFQCAAREAFYFGPGLDGKNRWRDDLANLVMLTYEGYSRNLAPVRLGDKLALLLTYGEVTRSSLQLCVRAVKEDGTPVTVGFQRILCVEKDTKEFLVVPESLSQYYGIIDEPLTGAGFAAAALEGGSALKKLFTDEVCALGKRVTAGKNHGAAFINLSGETLFDFDNVQPTTALDSGDIQTDKSAAKPLLKTSSPRTALVLPGQGSYQRDTIRSLYEAYPEFHATFADADRLALKYFGYAFLPLVMAKTDAEHDNLLNQCPNLDQIGIYLSGVLTAQAVLNSGLQVDGVLGHSVGEIGALTVSGAISMDAGLEIICRRIIALRDLKGCGIMAAIPKSRQEVSLALAELGSSSLEIAVVNHARQTVVSGNAADADRFGRHLATQGIGFTPLRSHYPFHSSLLSPAVGAFAASLGHITARATTIDLFSPMDGHWHSHGRDILEQLPSHLITPLDFQTALTQLYDEGVRTFIHCGQGNSIATIIAKALGEPADLRALPALVEDTSASVSIDRLKITDQVSSPVPSTPIAAQAVRQTEAIASVNPEVPHSDQAAMETPIAIVGLGGVFPGAKDVAGFWHHVVEGVSGIVDLGELDPDMRDDFLSPEGVQPDKAYSLLIGQAPELDHADHPGLRYSRAEFLALPKVQQYLAVALAEALGESAAALSNIAAERIRCLVGATADGSIDHDMAQFSACIADMLQPAADSAEERFIGALDAALGVSAETIRSLAQSDMYEAVVDRQVGQGIFGYVVDTACSSSLYTAALGIHALRDGECDVALAGGVYEANMANSCLFSQFKGLSSSGSRPLDASADGVVFGSGAAILVLKRLPDAVAAGDKIWGVIRSIGLSSDGKSPSVNVPQAEGQLLSMHRAYENSGIDPATVQVVEAHATATPVGDTTEFKALSQMFGHLSGRHPAIILGSVKATVGHTGWLAGAASVIKLCKSMEQSLIPAQHLWTRPSDKIDLANSPFSISAAAQPWLPNSDGQPRRAGVDGFGFGGTNAHLIVDQYLPAYHDRLPVRPVNPPTATTLAIVGVGDLFPNALSGAAGLPASGGLPPRFAKSALGLPTGKPLLPDAVDQMDTSQLLALLAVEQALQDLKDWQSIAEDIAVIVGIEGKTTLGISANEMIFKDRLFRQLRDRRNDFPVNDSEWSALLEQLDTAIQTRNRPSGSYTLPGCMPNVVAGRVANYFNLKGPNMVIDKGAESLAQTFEVATQLLRHGDCKLALLGAINAHGGNLAAKSSPRQSADGAKPVGEAALMLAVTTPDEAAAQGWPVLGLVQVETAASQSDGISQAVGATAWDYRGAEGVVELMAAVDRAQSGQATILRWGATAKRQIRLLPNGTTSPAEIQHSGFVTGTPIINYTPTLVPESLTLERPALSLASRRILFLTDDPQSFQAMAADGGLTGLNYRIVSPIALPGSATLTVDTTSESSIAESLRALADFPFDTLIAVRDLSRQTGKALLEQPWDSRFVELIFAVAQHAYENLGTGQVVLGALCLGGTDTNGLLDPETGLVAGFLKSLTRELPTATCRIVQTTALDLKTGLQELSAELGDGCTGGLPVETCYLAGRRHVLMLSERPTYAAPGQPLLNASSVVVATGGGRGVTAVLVESMLESIGCTVVLLGRTDLSAIPATVLTMDDQTFRDYETLFYREQMTLQPGARLSESRQRYQALAAARELQAILNQLGKLRGTVIYRAVDITNRKAVDGVIADVAKELGRIDLVVHGAGIQTSRRLPKKTLYEIRSTIATKVSGLHHIYGACRRHLPNRTVHYHLLTSAFSVMGNDGQPDYGAANEALNRIAARMTADGGSSTWSTIAWLGWDSIGMTRGSEFAALGSERQIRGVTAEEGKALFQSLLAGPPAQPINVLLTAGELEFFQVPLTDSVPTQAAPPAWSLSLADIPFAVGHQVNGKPTIPGAYELELAAQAAKAALPELPVIGFDHCRFLRFVKLSGDAPTNLRSQIRILERTGRQARVEVVLLSDFVHSSGVVLETDVRHLECEVVLGELPGVALQPRNQGDQPVSGMTVMDPYNADGAAVYHGGVFHHLHWITLGTSAHQANFRFVDHQYEALLARYITPFLAIDAALTLSILTWNSDGSMPVCVAAEIGSIRWDAPLNDNALNRAPQPVTITTSASRHVNGRILGDWMEVRTADGKLAMTITGTVAQPYGVVDSVTLLTAAAPSNLEEVL
ncbi:MAG: SDR family NAD(P)-dependent oxidoreductase [Methylobacter tundripaludum]|uniref:Beta-ketoacyl synthase-like protein n=1 Tax=Methylobacter tundripaludum TaxID=173365 RepID=A0A2S6GVM3_9GAMM|nr:type I polyketide synthase [Methylobacter tundripaludum]MCF7965764.1 SDR family NAD(P)-dependent oxidoreductase [Methylobacter tundripaludum]PPK69274.1 beta-ketoacyl synthase-like protein [Methylobacter tundripaludum]